MKEFWINLKKVWKYGKGQKKKLIIYICFGLANVAFSIAFPLMSANMIVNLTSNLVYQFVSMALVYFLLVILCDSFAFFKTKLYEKMVREIYIDIQTDLGTEILKLDNKTLEENGSGLFIQRLVGDTRNISMIFTDLNSYLTRMLTNIGILVTYFVISKLLFAFIIISCTVRMILESKRIKKYNANDKEYRKFNDELTGFTGEIVRGAEDIKMLNGEESFINELRRRFKFINNKKYEMESTNVNYLLARWYWSDFSMLMNMMIIAYSISNGLITIASGVVLYNLGNRYVSFIDIVNKLQETIKKFNLSAERIFDIFGGEKYTKEVFGNEHLENISGDFEFKNVSFKYDKVKVLNKINFKVNANETVAFVGKSGAGKTTIFNLLCKMYDGYTGKILIDGNDIKKLDKDSIRGNITIVSQNPYIFNMSIKENLKLVKEDLTDKEMKEACKMACLDDFINSLPNKYDTKVGEGGVMLSGGQKQRLAIARAFVQKTEIILFDEATSALDNETQTKIQEAIENLKKDYTILIIAHRLSTIKNANKILFLDEGKIIAEGTHKELLKKCVKYKELYNSELSKNDLKYELVNKK